MYISFEHLEIPLSAHNCSSQLIMKPRYRQASTILASPGQDISINSRLYYLLPRPFCLGELCPDLSYKVFLPSSQEIRPVIHGISTLVPSFSTCDTRRFYLRPQQIDLSYHWFRPWSTATRHVIRLISTLIPSNSTLSDKSFLHSKPAIRPCHTRHFYFGPELFDFSNPISFVCLHFVSIFFV